MNRRQRRAAAAKTPASNGISSASEIPMARPPSPNASTPKAKTLYEIAAERQRELAPHGQPFPKDTEDANIPKPANETKFVTLTPGGTISDTPSSATASEALPPFLDTLLLSAPLSSLHFTLAFLTFHQYGQPDSLSVPSLIKESLFVAFPTLTLLIHIVHGHALPSISISTQTRLAVKIAQQLAFIITANIAGCYLIYLTNDRGYYAVMKRAPAIGTLWVWCILELGLMGALVGVVGPGLFAWWNGYGVF
jgi:hypothetical protein